MCSWQYFKSPEFFQKHDFKMWFTFSERSSSASPRSSDSSQLIENPARHSTTNSSGHSSGSDDHVPTPAQRLRRGLPSPWQAEVLDNAFQQDPYCDKIKRDFLADALEISTRTVMVSNHIIRSLSQQLMQFWKMKLHLTFCYTLFLLMAWHRYMPGHLQVQWWPS